MGSAIVDLCSAVNSSLAQPKAGSALAYMKPALDALSALSSGQYGAAVAPLGELFNALDASGHRVPTAIREYVPAGLELASAKTAGDVQTVLDTVSSPVGAWRMKRVKPMVSIGGLVGLGGAYELAMPGTSTSVSNTNAQGFVTSVFAPVGFDFSWPVDASTLGFFVSVLDLGDLVGARVASGDGSGVKSTSQNASIEQVFAPGFYLRAGLLRSPLVLSAGINWAPDLRQLTLTDGEVVNANAVRAGLQLSVDLTMFPL
jgi:hypothetical protein